MMHFINPFTIISNTLCFIDPSTVLCKMLKPLFHFVYNLKITGQDHFVQKYDCYIQDILTIIYKEIYIYIYGNYE